MLKTSIARQIKHQSGSMNTVLGHLFYSGSTNGTIVLPKSLESVAVTKGEESTFYLRGDESLNVVLESDDFAFGVLPSHEYIRRINFPNTEAKIPCIHDFAARQKEVSLKASSGAQLLQCTWTSSAGGVSVSNIAPRSASITGKFSAKQTRSVKYSLEHLEYLFGKKDYVQTVRFCPKPEDESEDEENEEWWFEEGESGAGEDNESHSEDELGNLEKEEFEDTKPEEEYQEEYKEAKENLKWLDGVLFIHEPETFEKIHLDVPTTYKNCCPCPSHWTNFVAVTYRSSRLKVLDEDGVDFDISEKSCNVKVAGIYPSKTIGDATLAFTQNGKVYREYKMTVLGVAIKSDESVNLQTYNSLSNELGLPITVCTNVWNATKLKLVTNVELPGGDVCIEFADVTGQFALWYFDVKSAKFEKLLDSDEATTKTFPMLNWKVLMKRITDNNSLEMPLYVTSSSPGSVRLKLRYWNAIEGRFVQDEAEQKITSLRPVLRFDVNRDGAIDDEEKTFKYWTNEDKIKGDCIGEIESDEPNANDLKVNGTFDLINFFPVAIDLSKFANTWQERVTYTIKQIGGSDDAFNFCFANVPWSAVANVQTASVVTVAGEKLANATLMNLSKDGVELTSETLNQFSENSGVMICEAKSKDATLELEIKRDEQLLYSYKAPMKILPVRKMYSWMNERACSGGSVVRTTEFHMVDDKRKTKALIFLHGANVNEEDAGAWGDIIFKRMWSAGMDADFYNVAWRSDIGNPANYHENASNAFVVASQIVDTIKNIPGEKVLMAHSLGNVVASSMIQDYGLKVSKYIMCNSAVPAEAYDTSVEPSTALIHKDWEEYPAKARANEWHNLFNDDNNDDRRLLTWKGRFASVVNYAVNFYSTSDHVLELEKNNNVWATDGYENWEQKYQRYSWHKQELWKGRKGFLANIGTTDWAGWSIRENVVGYNTIQPTNAWLMTDEELKTNTVFKLQPESMNTNYIPILLRGALLAKGIPARTPACGATWWSSKNVHNAMYNLDSIVEKENGISRPNGWPVRTFGWLITTTWTTQWLHSDMKDISYFYVFKFFKKVNGVGGLECEPEGQ